MIGDRVKRARAAKGLSMDALGKLVGVSANMIKKYEHNKSTPSSKNLIKLARSLGVRSEYFYRTTNVELKSVEYRKRSSTPKRILERINADVLDQAERWQELANLWPNFPVPEFSFPDELTLKLETYDDIDKFADLIRKNWSLGLNPIPDLIDVLESRGLLVIVTDVDENAKFDGLQCTVAGKKVIVVSSNWPGDRQRFTLAHELGHLLLEGRLSNGLEEEKACHRFAASFLLPSIAIRQHLGEVRHMLEVRELYLLKKEYGLSMQACLYRAADLAIIDTGVCQKLFRVFAKNGWRKKEPGDAYKKEGTLLFQQLIFRALGEGVIEESKAAELQGVSLVKFHRARKLEGQHADAN